MKRTFKLSNLKLPTPKVWKRIGATLLTSSMFISGFSLYEGEKWIAVTSFVIGLIGTILTNFFADEV